MSVVLLRKTHLLVGSVAAGILLCFPSIYYAFTYESTLVSNSGNSPHLLDSCLLKSDSTSLKTCHSTTAAGATHEYPRILALIDGFLQHVALTGTNSTYTRRRQKKQRRRKKSRGKKSVPTDGAKDNAEDTMLVAYDACPSNSTTCHLRAWQTANHPNCENLHSIDFLSEKVSYINSGYLRAVWSVPEFDGSMKVMKTLKMGWGQHFSPYSFDIHRKEAITHEVLTPSPYVGGMYGYCGTSGLFDYSVGGTLADLHNQNISSDELLKTALHIARAVEHLHNIDHKGRATIVHNDLHPQQFIMIDGQLKLNDFHHNELLAYYDDDSNASVPFKGGGYGGSYQSPEEFRKDEETEKVDVWALGNIFYFMLTGKEPDEYHLKRKFEQFYLRVSLKVKKGHRPIVYVYNRSDTFERAMVGAMDICLEATISKRGTSSDIVRYLERQMASTTPLLV